ncbi:MAG: hypothetical protein KYX68_13070 [Flavobacterium sp.]|nr:hypothetical protein [Flavobacterium sp.]
MKKIILVLFFLFIYCKTVKKEELYLGSGKEQAIFNIINDFSKTEKTKKGEYYEIVNIEESKDFYRFLISNNFKINIDTINLIGLKPSYIPSKFKEINNCLYIWSDSSVAVNEKMIKMLDKYNAIDSTIFKIQKGMLSESQWPVIENSENIKMLSYYVCKKNVSIYNKKWATHKYSIDEDLLKKCK